MSQLRFVNRIIIWNIVVALICIPTAGKIVDVFGAPLSVTADMKGMGGGTKGSGVPAQGNTNSTAARFGRRLHQAGQRQSGRHGRR